MMLFLLLLVSTGLMYYFFQRSRLLEKELTAWRSGKKPSQAEMARSDETLGEAAKAVIGTVKDMPAPAAIRRLSGEPAEERPAPDPGETPAKPAEESTARPALSEAKPATTQLSEPRRLASGESRTPMADPPATAESESKAYQVPKSPYPDGRPLRTETAEAPVNQPRAETVAAESPVLSPSPEPAAQPDGSAATEPAVRMKVPQRAPKTRTATVNTENGASNRKIRSMYTAPQPETAPNGDDEVGAILKRTGTR